MPGEPINESDFITDAIEIDSMDMESTLKSIYTELKNISGKGLSLSQSSLRDLADAERQRQSNRNSYGSRASSNQTFDTRSRQHRYRDGFDQDSFFDRNYGRRRSKGMFDRLTDDFEDSFREAMLGTGFSMKDALSRSVAAFADSLDTDVEHLGQELGRRLGEQAKNVKIHLGGQEVNLGDQ